MIRMMLPMEPFGAARTRTRAFNTGRRGKRGQPVFSVQHYMDENYREWREAAVPYFKRAAPGAPLIGPLSLQVLIVTRFLETHRRKKHVPRQWNAVKPDGDNITKAVLDCAEEAGWMKNDAQVSRCVWEKIRAAQGEEACLHVVVAPLEIPYHLR